jgi:pyruvate-formate lyase-activating enzyme
MQQIGNYVQVLKIGKGGITLSGGEPIVQKPFTLRIFRRCKELDFIPAWTHRAGSASLHRPELMDIDSTCSTSSQAIRDLRRSRTNPSSRR